MRLKRRKLPKQQGRRKLIPLRRMLRLKKLPGMKRKRQPKLLISKTAFPKLFLRMAILMKMRIPRKLQTKKLIRKMKILLKKNPKKQYMRNRNLREAPMKYRYMPRAYFPRVREWNLKPYPGPWLLMRRIKS